MYHEPLSRFVKDWDEFLERWYAPVVVYLVSVGISFFWLVLLIGGLNLFWLTFLFILYRDRTRPEGFRTIRGSEVIELERRYFTTAGARLPYYKIERIQEAGQIRFQRRDH